MAQDKLNPTHYFENKWYHCLESHIKPVVEKMPKCSTPIGKCADYDSKGNMIYKRDSGYEFWYEYDTKGNMIHIRGTNGIERWHEYDAKGNKILERNSDGDEWRSEYDAKGNLIHAKSNAGSEAWYEYYDGNMIHVIYGRDHGDAISNLVYSHVEGDEGWYKQFFDEENNKEYLCDVDMYGNPVFNKD